VRSGEELAAQADDRLLRASVSVRLEALAVVADEAHVVLLRPEDVVREEAVAVVRGLLCDLRRADRAVPDERRHAAERSRGRLEALERGAESAGPVDDVLAPEAVEEAVVLECEWNALADVLAEPRVDGCRVPAAEHE